MDPKTQMPSLTEQIVFVNPSSNQNELNKDKPNYLHLIVSAILFIVVTIAICWGIWWYSFSKPKQLFSIAINSKPIILPSKDVVANVELKTYKNSFKQFTPMRFVAKVNIDKDTTIRAVINNTTPVYLKEITLPENMGLNIQAHNNDIYIKLLNTGALSTYFGDSALIFEKRWLHVSQENIFEKYTTAYEKPILNFVEQFKNINIASVIKFAKYTGNKTYKNYSTQIYEINLNEQTQKDLNINLQDYVCNMTLYIDVSTEKIIYTKIQCSDQETTTDNNYSEITITMDITNATDSAYEKPDNMLTKDIMNDIVKKKMENSIKEQIQRIEDNKKYSYTIQKAD